MPESDAEKAKREASAEAEAARKRALKEIEQETRNNRPRDER